MNKKNTLTEHIIVFGGTFSPVHADHIRLAREVCDKLHPTLFLFLPNKSPVLEKHETAKATDRINMLGLAIAPWADTYPFQVDRREVDRQSPSYMYITMTELRKQHPEATISLLIGMDSYLSFARWKNPESILASCNLIVVERPGYVCPDEWVEYPTSPARSGAVYHCRTRLCEQDLSSTQLRQCLSTGIDPGEVLPAGVCEYIRDHHLYNV